MTAGTTDVLEIGVVRIAGWPVWSHTFDLVLLAMYVLQRIRFLHEGQAGSGRAFEKHGAMAVIGAVYVA